MKNYDKPMKNYENDWKTNEKLWKTNENLWNKWKIDDFGAPGGQVQISLKFY